MALQPREALAVLESVDGARLGPRRLSLLHALAERALTESDPEGWFSYGCRDFLADGRSAEQAKYDRTVLAELVRVHRILQVHAVGGSARHRYRFRSVSRNAWVMVPWLTSKAAAVRGLSGGRHARLLRVSPGQKVVGMRDRGRFRGVEKKSRCSDQHRRDPAVARPWQPVAAKRPLDESRCLSPGITRDPFSTGAQGVAAAGAPHIGKAARSTSGGARVTSSSGEERPAARGPQEEEGTREARRRVKAAIVERCRQADGSAAWLGPAAAAAVTELVATYPADELVEAVERIAGAGVRAVPEVVRQLVDQAAAGFPRPAAEPPRYYDRIRVDCPACQGMGWVETDGVARPCDHEHRAATG